jgi:hypothetical protein
MYEPFRESAAWIMTLPACRDQVVLVISTDRANWYKPGYAEAIYTSGYGRYLHGFARPELLFFHDVRAHALPAELKAELQRRIDGEGCPVLAWSAHNITAEVMDAARSDLIASADRISSAAVKVKAFQDGGTGFVLYREGSAR